MTNDISRFMKQMPLNELPRWALEERKEVPLTDDLSSKEKVDAYKRQLAAQKAEDKEMADKLATYLTGGKGHFKKAFLELAKITVPAFRIKGLIGRSPAKPITLGAPKKISNEDDRALVAYVDERYEKGVSKRESCRLMAEAFTNNVSPITGDSLYARYKKLKRKTPNPE